MEKINVAELLKDCPKGMKLDCAMYNDVEFCQITNDKDYPIKVLIKDPVKGETSMVLTKEGHYHRFYSGKCVIFPKGKTSWEGFQRPFVNGDIVATSAGEWIGIMEKEEQCGKLMSVYCVLRGDNGLEIYHEEKRQWCFDRLATEKEKQRLFNALRKNKYEWNSKEKCLEPLIIKPKFKIGDEIKFSCNGSIFIITAVDDKCYYLVEKGNTITFQVLINLDRDWELVSKKFDITTLKRFDKVLVRDCNTDKWDIDFFGYYSRGFYHTTGRCSFRQCIPYRGHEHIVGTSVDCADYYKNWD